MMVSILPRLIFTSLVVMARFTPGLSQAVNVTRSTTNAITCPGEFIEFTCTVDTVRSQWLAPPYITIANPITFTDNPNILVQPFSRGPDDTITVGRLRTGLLVTSLVVSGDLLAEISNITCQALLLDDTLVEESEPQMYQSGISRGAMPPTMLSVELERGCFGRGSIFVSFAPSPSPDIVGYMVDCIDNACMPALFGSTDGVLLANSSTIGLRHTVRVRAVNRCNQISDAVTQETNTLRDGCLIWMTVFILVSIIAIAIIIGLTIAAVVFYRNWKELEKKPRIDNMPLDGKIDKINETL